MDLLDTTIDQPVLVPIANGFEEIETLTVVDILRRAGINVTIAGISQEVTGRCGVRLLADVVLSQAILEKEYAMIFVTGGLKHSLTMSEHQPFIDRLRLQKTNDKYIAAICAAPFCILQKHGLIDLAQKQGQYRIQTRTCNPDFGKEFNLGEDRVVQYNKILTSRAAGTAMEFAFKLVEVLIDKQKSFTIAKSILARI